MKISCDVAQDLIPLVKDGVASQDSTLLLQEHLNNCTSCKEVYESFSIHETQKGDHSRDRDEKIIAAVKRSVFVTQMLILIGGALVGIAMTETMGMFYNIVIMPALGAIAYLSFGKKSFFTPIVIFILTYLYQTIIFIAADGFDKYDLLAGLLISPIYCLLVFIGIIVAILLKFAFKKEVFENEI